MVSVKRYIHYFTFSYFSDYLYVFPGDRFRKKSTSSMHLTIFVCLFYSLILNSLPFFIYLDLAYVHFTAWQSQSPLVSRSLTPFFSPRCQKIKNSIEFMPLFMSTIIPVLWLFVLHFYLHVFYRTQVSVLCRISVGGVVVVILEFCIIRVTNIRIYMNYFRTMSIVLCRVSVYVLVLVFVLELYVIQ